jgi:hypothetical protein
VEQRSEEMARGPSHWSTHKPKRPQRLPSGPSQLPTQPSTPSKANQSQSAIVAQAATPARDSPESPILTPIGRKSACVMCGDVARTVERGEQRQQHRCTASSILTPGPCNASQTRALLSLPEVKRRINEPGISGGPLRLEPPRK